MDAKEMDMEHDVFPARLVDGRSAWCLRSVMAALCALLLCSCAVMDLSTLDTAVPLAKKHVNVVLGEGTGVSVSTLLLGDEADTEDVDLVLPTYGITASYGASDKVELGGRYYTSFYNTGAKIYLKYLIQHQDKSYISLIPAGNYVFLTEDDYDDGEYYLKSSIYGTELQLLYTYQANRSLALTAGLRGNFSRYQERKTWNDIVQSERGPYNLFHYGVRTNLDLRLGDLKLLPELGLEFFPLDDGEYKVIPLVAVGLGLEL